MKKAVRPSAQPSQTTKTQNCTPNKQRYSVVSNNNKCNQSRPACQNHPDRNSSHILMSQESDDTLFYCEKCSIMLASQGFNVMRIQGSVRGHSGSAGTTPIRGRLDSIQSFLGSLEKHLEILSVKYTEVEDTLVQSQENYSNIMTKITNYYDSIQQILDLQRYLSYNSLLTRRSIDENPLRQLKSNLKTTILQIQDMMNDIQNNLEAVEGVQASIYMSIMQGYSQKLKFVPDLIEEDVRTPKEYSIGIPELPITLNCLSEQFVWKVKFIPQQTYNQNAVSRQEIRDFYSNSQVRAVYSPNENQCLRKSHSQYLPEQPTEQTPESPFNPKAIRENQNLHNQMESMRFSFESREKTSLRASKKPNDSISSSLKRFTMPVDPQAMEDYMEMEQAQTSFEYQSEGDTLLMSKNHQLYQ